MWVKKIALISTAVLLSIPVIAQADIVVENNTGFYGTAKTSFTPCSSKAAEVGVLQPNSKLEVSQSILNTFCSIFACQVKLYLSNNCSGKQVAKVKVSAKKGIESFENLDPERIRISVFGNYARIDPA